MATGLSSDGGEVEEMSTENELDSTTSMYYNSSQEVWIITFFEQDTINSHLELNFLHFK